MTGKRHKIALMIAAGTAMLASGELKDVPVEATFTKDMAGFGIAVRAAVRGLWRGYFDEMDFVVQMSNALDRYLTEAWHEGAARCGIRPEELTIAETQAMLNFIAGQYNYVMNFGRSVAEGSRANGGKLGPLLARAELWTERYNEARNRGAIMACGDQKMVWRLGPTRDHCRDCARLHGRVHRASVWEQYDVYPKNSNLECGGWRCLCQLLPTNLPGTPGRPPRLSGG